MRSQGRRKEIFFSRLAILSYPNVAVVLHLERQPRPDCTMAQNDGALSQQVLSERPGS
jgi:hypothetical protein